MDQKKTAFFGTPLSKFLSDDVDKDDYYSRSSRRAGLNQQQTVRDEEGRRRFHGAFTGGFSAGYYNTVGSVEGFIPKSFISHRGDKHHAGNKSSTTFHSKPEDYMDEEDFGEFGIAPKKLQVKKDYFQQQNSSDLSYYHSSDLDFLRPTKNSIGESILRCMSRRKLSKDDIVAKTIDQKNDFHGLGYTALSSKISQRSDSKQSINPLVAVLEDGKRLKISGSAFGSGVLDDDDDNVDITQEYGYDDISNYDFSRKSSSFKSSNNPQRPISRDNRLNTDLHEIDGFVATRKLKSSEMCIGMLDRYPLPQIDEDWVLPVRSEPYIPPEDELSNERQKVSMQKFQQASSSLVGKFTTGSIKTLASACPEQKSGLISYSSLKDIELKDQFRNQTVAKDHDRESQTTISRNVVEWRPCSLLCKHFKVPNPFPDNKFCGVRPAALASNPVDASDERDSAINRGFASLELRRSIFNVSFDHSANHSETSSNSTSEDEPQVLDSADVQEHIVECHHLEENSDPESDISVIDLPKPEPELIVISSSSRSLSPSSGEDLYGPPLPPSLKTLIDADRDQSRHKRSKSSKKRKKKSKKGKRRER